MTNAVETAVDAAAPSALDMNLITRVCAGDIVRRSADLFPDQIAVMDDTRSLSYRDLDRSVDQLAHALLGLGLKHQDIVAIMALNRIEFIITYFACARAGLICMPVNLGLLAHEISYCLRDAGAHVLIAEAALRKTVETVWQEKPDALQRLFWIDMDEDVPEHSFEALLASGSAAPLEVAVADRDVVQLLYTSGTTAMPKGVLGSHLAVTMTALTTLVGNPYKHGWVILAVLPTFHCALLNSGVIPFLTIGGTVVLTRGFDAARCAQLIDTHAVNIMALLPSMYDQWLNDPAYAGRTFPSVKRAVYGMAPMPMERLKAVHGMFPNADVVLASGQTEMTAVTCAQRPEVQWSKAFSWGTATAMTRIAIMEENGQLLPTGEVGEIVYRGPQVMNGYLNLPQENRACFRHGWFHSGDVAYMDEDGAVWFTDRLKDMVKSGGENVASIEVERCLLQHPAVAEVAVVGAPHPRWGEAVVACVSLLPGQESDEATLIAHCRQHLGGFKVPKIVRIVDTFPKTGTGKIQKNLVRAQVKHLFDKPMES